MELCKNKEYFIGVDSDGTVFDSMTIKHTKAFIPAMIQEWKLESYGDRVYEIAIRINLYSHERGINRFPGLVKTLDQLKKVCGETFPIQNYESLRGFVKSAFPMSNAGLKEYMKENSDAFLFQVLHWSETADKIFEAESVKLSPFTQAKHALKNLREKADIMVVSAASGEGLRKDWNRSGLMPYVNFIAGQEQGTKENQLKLPLRIGYQPEQCLMIGDSPGDYEAAQKSGILFYPIIPTHEEASWRIFNEKYFTMFIDGRYSRQTEQGLYKIFMQFLGEEIK